MNIYRDTITLNNWQKGRLIQISFGYACITLYTGGGVVRFLRFGFTWKDTTRHSLTFSERMKLTKFFRIGNWIFGWLPKTPAV
jgi:hypothetical protein